MHTTILRFGMPFDITQNAYWAEPNKSFKRPGKLKLLIKQKASSLSKSELDHLIATTTDYGLEMNEFFGVKVPAGKVLDPLITERLSQLDKVRDRKDPKQLDRFVLGQNMSYHYEFEQYLLSGDKRINVTWFVKRLNEFAESQAREILPDLKPGDTIDYPEISYQLLSPELHKELTIITNWLMSYGNDYPNTHVYCNLLLFIFYNLSHGQPEKIKDNVIAAWLCSYNSIIFQDIFGLVCYHFRELITTDRFPYLNHTYIQFFCEYLDEKRDSGITNYMHHLVFEPFKDNIVPKALELDESFDVYLNIKEQVELVDFNAVQHTVQHLHDLIANFKQLVTNAGDAGKQKIVAQFVSQPDPVYIASSHVPQSAIFDLRQKLQHIVFQPFTDQAGKFAEELTANDKERQSIEEKSKSIENPLDNIDALTKLAERKKELKQHAEQLTGTWTAKVVELVQLLIDALEQHNAMYPVQQNPLESDNVRLSGLLNDARRQIAELKESKAQLSEQITKQQAQPEQLTTEAAPTLPIEKVLSLLESKEPAVDIVKAVIDIRKDVLIPSDTLIKSLSQIKSFTRPVELARQLLTVSSKEFLDDYAENGSVGAFNHFSKTALSFKESESTMKNVQMRRKREFSFSQAGKGKLLCEPHLRLGVRNTEQEQLRIHFVIDEGKVYLGYIGRHLPISAV